MRITPSVGTSLGTGAYTTAPWGTGADTTEPLLVALTFGGVVTDLFQANGLTVVGPGWTPNGDGTARLIKNVQPWSIEGLQVAINENRNDHQFLQELANGNVYFDVTVTYSGGATYGGKGQLVGDPPQHSAQSASATISLMGEGSLTKQ